MRQRHNSPKLSFLGFFKKQKTAIKKYILQIDDIISIS